MIKRIIAMMLGLSVATIAGAVNDPDSTGRYVKYLDVMTAKTISYYTPDSQCFQYTNNPEANAKITCVALATDGAYNALPLTAAGDIAVAANASRSLITVSMNPVANYYMHGVTGGTSTLYLNAQVKITIESSVLSDPSLINPLTGQPFNGKIETTSQWIYDMRHNEPSGSFQVATKQPFETTVLSRRGLTSGYGLSATRAALVFARPITVKIELLGGMQGSGMLNFFMGARLFGD